MGYKYVPLQVMIACVQPPPPWEVGKEPLPCFFFLFKGKGGGGGGCPTEI